MAAGRTNFSLAAICAAALLPSSLMLVELPASLAVSDLVGSTRFSRLQEVVLRAIKAAVNIHVVSGLMEWFIVLVLK